MRGRDDEREPRCAAGRKPHAAPDGAGAETDGLLWLQRVAGNSAVAAAMDAEGGGPAVQRSAVHDVLRSPGARLDGPVREEMEARLDADFSTVRVHTDSSARRSAAELDARAYTAGEHLVIGEGGADRPTLAHELIHVLQQREGPVAGTDAGGGVRVSDPTDRFEREAERDAHRALSGPVPTGPGHAHAAGNPASPPRGSHQVQRASAGDDAWQQELTIRDRPGGDEPAGKRRRVAPPSSSESDSSGELDSTEWPPSPDRTGPPGPAHLDRAGQRDARARGRVLPWLLEEQDLADYLDYRALAVLSGMDSFLPAPRQEPGAGATPLPAEHGAPSVRELRSLISAKVSERLPGVTDETMGGVLRLMASHGAPGRQLGDDPVRAGEGGAPAAGNALWREARDRLPTVLRHVGYRYYAAQQGSEMTLEEFGDRVLHHARLTALLAGVPPELRLPVRRVDQAVHEEVQRYLNQWVAGTRDVHGRSPNSARRPEDVAALSALDLISPMNSGTGHHLSVVEVGPTERAVYTNRPLAPQEVQRIQAHFAGQGQTCLFHYHTEGERSSWGPEQGRGRRGQGMSYPFHSELQQTEDREPWEMRDYVGSAFRGCAQCMRAFEALGVPTSLHWEAHSRKYTSVIPPRIRENTVYLERYLGKDVWDHWEGILSRAWSRLAGSSDPASTPERVPLDQAEHAALLRDLEALDKKLKDLKTAGEGDEGWRSGLARAEEQQYDLELFIAADGAQIGGQGDLATTAADLRRDLERQEAELDLALFFEFLSTVERVQGAQTVHPAKKRGIAN